MSTDRTEQILDDYTRKYERIRSEEGRTPEWRRQQLAKLYRAARGEAQKVLDADAASVAFHRRGLERKVYGLDGITGDPASLAISRRDAGDRAASLKSESEALVLLQRAERAGDEPLARAIIEKAVEFAWVNTANAFLQQRPHLNEEVNELWADTQNTLNGVFVQAATVGTLKPRELAGVSDFQIDRIADTPLQGRAALSGAALSAVRTEDLREAMQGSR